MNSNIPSNAATEDSISSYTRIAPSCPLCGNSRFVSTEEGIPNEFESHYVHVRCAHCRTHFTIEYRAIDLSWLDGADEQHSAVSQGVIDPIATDYVEAAQYGPLADSDTLGALDWPLNCQECEGALTGNDLVTDAEHEQPADAAEKVFFQCPNCEHLTAFLP